MPDLFLLRMVWINLGGMMLSSWLSHGLDKFK